MIKRADIRTNWIWILMCAGLLFLSFAAVVRSLFVGLDVDEQYAIVMSYRLAQGDLFLKEMWEPHQTSGILPALFLKIYLMIKGDSTYLLLYMRSVGVLIQGAIAFFWYETFQKDFGKKISFLTALVLFSTVPKWIVSPEFANQQIWYWIVTMLCLYRYGKDERVSQLVFAGVSFCFCVLAYPSAILLVVPFTLWLWMKNRKAVVWFLGTCVVGGSLFIGYLLWTVGPAEIMKGISYVMADPLHGEGASKLVRYGKEMVELALRVSVYGVIALGIVAVVGLVVSVWKKQRKQIDARENVTKQGFAGNIRLIWAFLWTMLAVTMIDQGRLWIMGQVPNVHPQLHYLLLFVIGGVLYGRIKAKSGELQEPEMQNGQWLSACAKDLFSLGWIPSILGFLAVILLTNLDLKASFVHLLPGVLVAMLYAWNKDAYMCEQEMQSTEEAKNGHVWKKYVLPVAWLILLLGARIFLLRGNWGASENLFVAKQKVLDGVAKGVYCNYMTGHEINENLTLLKSKVKPGEKVLYVGSGNLLIYVDLLSDVCSGTTISTVLFDQMSLEYYKENPEKMPEVVLVDKGFCTVPGAVSEEVNDWIRENYESVDAIENEFLQMQQRRD